MLAMFVSCSRYPHHFDGTDAYIDDDDDEDDDDD